MKDVFYECGCCGHYHRTDFYGDCRQDDERYHVDDLPENATIYDLESQMVND